MSIGVRTLDEKDLDGALPLLHAEGWMFEHDELERLRKLGGAVGAFDGEALVGFTTWVDHGDKLRWVGNVVVAPDQRGKGTGARLVEAAAEGAANVGLYSVEKAVPLYQRLGFQPRGEAWLLRAETATPKRKVTGAKHIHFERDSIGVLRLDEEATGVDRGAMLVALSEPFVRTMKVMQERNRIVAFGIAKTSATGTELGPLVAETPASRDALIDELLQLSGGPYEVTVLGNNAGAIQAFEARGFQKRFRTVPMFKGTPPKWRSSMIVAAAGLEKG